MICTKCEHHPPDKRKTWDNLPCSTCKLDHGQNVMNDADAYNHWRTKYSLESLMQENGDDFHDAETTGWGEEREHGLTEQDNKIEEYSRQFLRLTTADQRLACAVIIPNESIPLVCAELGFTVQEGHRRLDNMINQGGALGSILKRKGRR